MRDPRTIIERSIGQKKRDRLQATCAALMVIGAILIDAIRIVAHDAFTLVSIPNLLLAVGLFFGLVLVLRNNAVAMRYMASLWDRISTLDRRLPSVAIFNTYGFSSFLLIALQTRFLWGIWRSWDLPLYDGAIYLSSAARIASLHLPRLDWSPFYAAYYALYYLALRWTGLYTVYVVVRVATILLIGQSFLFLFRKCFSPITAWVLAAWGALLSCVLEDIFVVHSFLLFPYLLILAMVYSAPKHRIKILLVSSLVLFLSRPEFLFFVIVILVSLAYGGIRRKVALSSTDMAVGLSVATIAALVFVFGLTPSDRSSIAFIQHYALGYSERHPEWAMNWARAQEAVSLGIGNAHSFLQAVQVNPRAVLIHILWNIRTTPFGLILMMRPQGTLPKLGAIVILAMVLASPLVWEWPPKSLRLESETWRTIWRVSLAAAIPTMAAALLLHPDASYLMPLAPGFLLLLGLILEDLRSYGGLSDALAWWLALIFLLILTILPQISPKMSNYTHLNNYEALVEMNADSYNLAAYDARFYCLYLQESGAGCAAVDLSTVRGTTGDEIQGYFDENQVSVLLVNEDALIDTETPLGSYLNSLGRDPAAYGWKVFPNRYGVLIYYR